MTEQQEQQREALCHIVIVIVTAVVKKYQIVSFFCSMIDTLYLCHVQYIMTNTYTPTNQQDMDITPQFHVVF